MDSTSPPPVWTPAQGNLFHWVLQLVAEKRSTMPPPEPAPLTYKLRKI